MNRSQKQVMLLMVFVIVFHMVQLIGMVFHLDYVYFSPESLRPYGIFGTIFSLSVFMFIGCMAWRDEA